MRESVVRGGKGGCRENIWGGRVGGNLEKQTAPEYQNPPRPIKFQWMDFGRLDISRPFPPARLPRRLGSARAVGLDGARKLIVARSCGLAAIARGAPAVFQ